VFAALMLHEFDTVMGVEILQGLHHVACDIQGKWEDERRSLDISERTREAQITFICGDILQVDWSDADVCFANSTCFDDKLMEGLAERANLCKPGTFFITFTRRLPSEKWEVLEYERHLMSWGDATVYIHQRKAT